MWENSDLEIQLVNEQYQLRELIQNAEIQRMENDGDINQIIVCRKNEKGRIGFVSIATGIATFMIMCYYIASWGLCFSIAVAMIFVTGLGMIEIVLIVALVFLSIRYFVRHSNSNMWKKIAIKLHEENDNKRLQELLEDQAKLTIKINELNISRKECEVKLQEERDKYK